MYPIIEVPRHSFHEVEHLGTKDKFWFRSEDELWRLCKLRRSNTGEDWSEKVASELAAALNLPHAEYELGTFENKECVITPRCFPDGYTLVHGNELLSQLDAGYGVTSEYRESAHTIEAISLALAKTPCALPPDWFPTPGVHTPLDLFAGYLLLDALIGNTDRHHQNWGVVEPPAEKHSSRFLAPTYDHASSLGRELTDAERTRRLNTRDRQSSPEAYANKARSALFPDPSATAPLSTIAAFQRAAVLVPTAANRWIEELRKLSIESIDRILSALPPHRCSQPSLDFARRVLLHNKERVLALAKQL